MTEGTIEYYRYKISRGMDISVEVLPRRGMRAKSYYVSTKDGEDAAVCLSCDRKKCGGSQKCFDRQRDRVLAAKRAEKGRGLG